MDTKLDNNQVFTMDIHRTIANAHDALLQIQQEHAYSTRLKDKKISEQRMYIEELETERDGLREHAAQLEVDLNNATRQIDYWRSLSPKCSVCGDRQHNRRWHWRN